ncbi:hypothetical protein GOP47_0007749 [Adiantum capillus-veneris]|uniref:Uncharacterized protein n=1 Tax=Adiantum capillus-veneris TaxID=13818 RepID=A0A9D4V1B1_ADICA|nr:hypothetical protein GOP47_0007749 [Adiantum capillus-veneris]
MGRSRRQAQRKPLAPKDSNIGHHAYQSHHDDAAKQMMDANHREADRRVSAIKAVCDAEVEGYLTQLRVALSMLSKEVREMPLGEFVSRFCPDRELIRASDSHIVELRQKSQKLTLADCPSVADSFEFHGLPIPSLQGQALSTPHGFPFSTSTVKDFSAQIARVAHDESEDEEFLKFMESFRSSKVFHSNVKIPATCDKLMVGVTPKTMRLPKTGETLLSVNGSPLGVYDKDGMTSIQEERPRRARRRLRASAMPLIV